MKIRISRTAGAVALASGLVASGLVLAAAPKKPASSPARGQAAEYASMCRFCENTGGACYAFGSGGASKELAMSTDGGMSADAGMGTDTCTYPPCSNPTAMSTVQLKLACASCRAMCPKTSGGPGAQTTPDQRK
jgi:hypothetical protein